MPSVGFLTFHKLLDAILTLCQLMPLLLRGLELYDTNIRADVIDTFLAVAEGDSTEQGTISEHASTLVSSMLKNSMVQEISSMVRTLPVVTLTITSILFQRIRIAALRYLAILPSIVRYDVLHPYKSTVIRELVKVLDDPKRAVRKEAVDAR